MTKRQAEQIRRAIKKAAGGTIFSVQFIKRTTGEVRDMVCRLGVAKDLTGEGLKFDPVAKKLLTVWDVQKKGYRSIPLDAIQKIVVRGETFEL